MRRMRKLLTLRVSPPAHPETMPRRVEVIREVGKHTEEQRAGETVLPQEGRMEEESEEEEEDEGEEEDEVEEEEEEEEGKRGRREEGGGGIGG